MTTRDIDETVRAELNRLRESIDNIDAAVVHMLAERFKCTQQVGHLKAAAPAAPGRPGPRGPPDRAAAAARGERETGPGVRREAAELHHRRGHPPPRDDRRAPDRTATAYFVRAKAPHAAGEAPHAARSAGAMATQSADSAGFEQHAERASSTRVAAGRARGDHAQRPGSLRCSPHRTLDSASMEDLVPHGHRPTRRPAPNPRAGSATRPAPGRAVPVRRASGSPRSCCALRADRRPSISPRFLRAR